MASSAASVTSSSSGAASSSSGSSSSSSARAPVDMDYDKEVLSRTFPKNIIPQLHNVVGCYNLKSRLDLRTIAMRARNAEYQPKRFNAVIMRMREPKTTALVFQSGKVVVTGAKDEKDLRLASRKFAFVVQKTGFSDIRFEEFTITNMVAGCALGFPIRLEGLANEHTDLSCYEPELFPGLIYRMVNPKVVVLVFVSGKVILTGAKSRADIYDAFIKIYPILEQYQKKNFSTSAPELAAPVRKATPKSSKVGKPEPKLSGKKRAAPKPKARTRGKPALSDDEEDPQEDDDEDEDEDEDLEEGEEEEEEALPAPVVTRSGRQQKKRKL